jgi:single-strand DNA-binding protein
VPPPRCGERHPGSFRHEGPGCREPPIRGGVDSEEQNMTDLITVTGVVGSDPRPTVTPAGLSITNFRLASTRRYFDRSSGQWTDGETNWYTVSTFRQLALNTATSLRKGQRVVVHGRLRLRAWQTEEKSGTAIEIDADSVGHDLAWGTTEYSKTSAAARSADANEAPQSRIGESESSASIDAWSTPTDGWAVGAASSDDSGSDLGIGADPLEHVDPDDVISVRVDA